MQALGFLLQNEILGQWSRHVSSYGILVMISSTGKILCVKNCMRLSKMRYVLAAPHSDSVGPVA
jgi:hypothetical protein